MSVKIADNPAEVEPSASRTQVDLQIVTALLVFCEKSLMIACCVPFILNESEVLV
jgi:hypothetical protein